MSGVVPCRVKIGHVETPPGVHAVTQIPDDLSVAVVASVRLPESPFRIPGNTDICQFNWAIGGAFAEVLRALADHFGDQFVSAAVIEPDPVAYYRREYGYDPQFTLSRSDLTGDHRLSGKLGRNGLTSYGTDLP